MQYVDNYQYFTKKTCHSHPSGESQLSGKEKVGLHSVANLQPLFQYFFPCIWNFPILHTNSHTPKVEAPYFSRMVGQRVHYLHMGHIPASCA